MEPSETVAARQGGTRERSPGRDLVFFIVVRACFLAIFIVAVWLGVNAILPSP